MINTMVCQFIYDLKTNNWNTKKYDKNVKGKIIIYK